MSIWLVRTGWVIPTFRTVLNPALTASLHSSFQPQQAQFSSNIISQRAVATTKNLNYDNKMVQSQNPNAINAMFPFKTHDQVRSGNTWISVSSQELLQPPFICLRRVIRSSITERKSASRLGNTTNDAAYRTQMVWQRQPSRYLCKRYRR